MHKGRKSAIRKMRRAEGGKKRGKKLKRERKEGGESKGRKRYKGRKGA